MSGNGRRDWTEEETTLAFELYCTVPYKELTNDNQEVVGLAKLLRRSPAAVRFKVFNLASFDPAHQTPKNKGFENTSKTDSVVYQKYSENLEALFYRCNEIKRNMGAISLVDESAHSEIMSGFAVSNFLKEVTAQAFFRKVVLNSFNNKCCVTEMEDCRLLITSHIKPEDVSDEKTERTNPMNGLCFNALFADAFKNGLFTILIKQHADTNPSYSIKFSNELSSFKMDEITRMWLLHYDGKEITSPENFLPKKEFIQYHNDAVFQKLRR